MKIKRKSLFLLLMAVLLSPLPVLAGDPGTTGAVELKIPVGPRAIAMGEAFGAVADDANAVYWNPAGLRSMKQTHVTLQYTDFIETVKYQYLAVGAPMRNNRMAIGLAGKMLSTGFEDAIDENAQPTGDQFNETYMEIGLAGAARVNYWLDFGLTAKYASKKLYQTSASTFAADLGFVYNAPVKSLRAALVLQNLGPGMKFGQASDKLPMNIKVGLAYKLFQDNLTLAYDTNFPNDNKPAASLGGEYWYLDKLVGRFGYRFQGGLDWNELGIGGKAGLFLGGGMKVPAFGHKVGIDYAWSTAGFLGSLHRVALNVYL
jgi:hypothetical protein